MKKSTLEAMSVDRLSERSTSIGLEQARADLITLGLTEAQITVFLEEIHHTRWLARLKDTCNLPEKIADYCEALLLRLSDFK